VALKPSVNNGIRTFEHSEAATALVKELVNAVNLICESANTGVLSNQQVELLAHTLPEAYPEAFEGQGAGASVEDPNYGADFDMSVEVNDQIRTVRALRAMVINENGTIKTGYTARDAKELISASGTLLGSLMKFHDKIINQSRMRMVEQATIEVIKTLPEDSQVKFFETLKIKLEAIK